MYISPCLCAANLLQFGGSFSPHCCEDFCPPLSLHTQDHRARLGIIGLSIMFILRIAMEVSVHVALEPRQQLNQGADTQKPNRQSFHFKPRIRTS